MYQNNTPNQISFFQFASLLISPINNNTLVDSEFDRNDWEQINQFAKRHKISTPLYQKISTNKLNIPAAIFNEFHQQAVSNSTQMLQLASELVRLGNLFAHKKIHYISLKGPALALMLYNDLAGKQSGDLDILVSPEMIWLASSVLTENGYIRQHLPKTLTKSQANYLIHSYHHIGFVHSEKKIYVELHWRVNTNIYAEPFSFIHLWNNASSIKIGDTPIPCLAAQNALIHQLVHGAGHAWFALAWLRDTIALACREDVNLFKVWEWALNAGYDRMVAQGLLLGERVFGPFLGVNLRQLMQTEATIKLVDFAYAVLTNHSVPEFMVNPKFGRIKQKIYLSKLKKDWNYKKQVWIVIGTNPRDWQIINLPDKYFVLYYILRPFLYLYTVYIKKQR